MSNSFNEATGVVSDGEIVSLGVESGFELVSGEEVTLGVESGFWREMGGGGVVDLIKAIALTTPTTTAMPATSRGNLLEVEATGTLFSLAGGTGNGWVGGTGERG